MYMYEAITVGHMHVCGTCAFYTPTLNKLRRCMISFKYDKLYFIWEKL